MKVASAAQMRRMDKQTIDEYGVPSIVLMENAALRVVEEIARRYSPLRGKRIAVVCGKGNNGGDGLAIARHLAACFGADVTVWLADDPAEFKGDAKVNYQMAQSFGLDVRQVDPALVPPLDNAALVVDALLGTGIKG
ncbi:MAG: NAD(P)H-hydrate epimerase, partial [Armatimonadota bacterium]|nr:NAD(P)H-hydrate epimerase [Armatimonadota bacterium]